MRKILIIYLFLSFESFFGQNNLKPIYIDLIKQYYLPTKLMSYDSFFFEKTKFFKFYLVNEMGEMKFEIISNKKSIIKGSYSNSIGVFKRYIESFSPDGSSEMDTEEYYFPLKDGDWTFYDVKTKLTKAKIYKKGVASFK